MVRDNHDLLFGASAGTVEPSLNLFTTDDRLAPTDSAAAEQAISTDLRLICVVAPALNEEPTLQSFFDSLKGQHTNYPFAVVVADNGSTDKTAALAAYHGANVVDCPEPGVTLARQAGLNYVLNAARSSLDHTVVVQVDVDESLDVGYIQAIGDAFFGDQNLMASSGPTIYPIRDGQEVRLVQTGREFRDAFATIGLKELFAACGRDVDGYLIGPRHRMLVAGNTAYRATLFSEYHLTYPETHLWESVAMSISVQQAIGSAAMTFIPGQRLMTSPRSYEDTTGTTTHDKLERIRQLGYIPPFKAPETTSPMVTVARLIDAIDAKTYRLRSDEQILCIDAIEAIDELLASQPGLSVRIVPALHAVNRVAIPDKYAVIVRSAVP